MKALLHLLLACAPAAAGSVDTVGFNEKSDFKTFRFRGKFIECEGTPRPLFHNDASGTAVVENNKLTNMSDTSRYNNAPTGKARGLEQMLHFTCGVNDELTADGWKTCPTAGK